MKSIFQLKRTLLLFLFPLSFLCLCLAKSNGTLAEKLFARGIYPYYSTAISWIFGWIPFSMGEILLYVMVIGLVIWLIQLILHISRNRKSRGNLIKKALLNLICLASVLFFLYTIGCGVNYYRYPFTHYSGLVIQESTEEELYELCVSLATKAASVREQIVGISEERPYRLTMTKRQLSIKVRDAYEDLSLEYPVLGGHYPAAKPLLSSVMMSKMELTGIFWPFTMEANVNVDAPDFSLAATMGHELTHLHGFMREDEANFIAYLACDASSDPEVRYSGIMEALILSGNALYRINPEKYQQVAKQYTQGLRADLIDSAEYWAQFEDTIASKVADKVNDTYLKANAQADGTRSYGRAVDLFLAKYRKERAE